MLLAFVGLRGIGSFSNPKQDQRVGRLYETMWFNQKRIDTNLEEEELTDYLAEVNLHLK